MTRHWPALLVCMGLVLLYNVTNYMVTGYLPTYQSEPLHRSSGSADLLVLIGMVWIVVLITFVGRLSDRIGRRPVYGISAAAMILLAVPSFQLIRMHGTWPPVLGVLLLATLLACFAAPSAATLPALFPTAVRYAAMGLNIAVAAFGGTTPLVTAALVNATGDDLMPAYYLMLAGAIGLLTVRFLPESAQVPLAGSRPMVGSRAEQRRMISTSKELYAACLRDRAAVGGTGRPWDGRSRTRARRRRRRAAGGRGQVTRSRRVGEPTVWLPSSPSARVSDPSLDRV